jgi:HEAT repeat protein
MEKIMARSTFAATLLMVLFCFVPPGNAQGATPNDVSQLLQQLNSPSQPDRSRALYALLDLGAGTSLSQAPYDVPPRVTNLLQQYATQADQIELALIALLTLENPTIQLSYQQPVQSPLSEDQTEYYADLVAAISSLNDPRTIDSLVGAVMTGDMASSALAAFGDAAVNPLIHQLRTTTDDLVQFSSLFALAVC